MRLKIILSLFGLGLFTSTVCAQVDTTALFVLQRVNTTLKDIKTLSVHVQAFYDTPSASLGLIKRVREENVYASFPNHLFINTQGDDNRHSLIYDGKQLVYYSYVNNSYSTIDKVPGSILETVDLVSKTYGIEVPAADFFYPSFVNDIKTSATTLSMLGLTKIDGKECLHIAGKDATMSYQFWISNDEFFLPVKMAIVYYNRVGTPQYEANYSNWKLNADLPASLFEFAMPPNAEKVAIKPVTAQ